jgi:ATP-dependent DNA helicase RecG
VLGVLVRCGGDYLRALWFNQPFLQDKFRHGDRLLLTGKPRLAANRWEMAHPRVQALDRDEEPPAGRIVPVYPLTEGLNQSNLRKASAAALEKCAGQLDDVFPEAYRQTHNLLPINEAIQQVHYPDTLERVQQARRRLVYQELFVLQLALAVKRRRAQQAAAAPSLPANAVIDARIRRLFPFEFTAGQRQAIAEITADMAQTVPMNRLLQGEVGSGKTAVAVYAMLLAVAHKQQAVLMAPTEILAQQHHRTLSGLLAAARARVSLLSGGLSAAERRAALAGIADGSIDLVIGTQAVVQDGVQFARLGLVVIDEQHKFGVEQRARLKQAGAAPHYLVMTATPIPRSIAMTVFGDLDASSLREAPAGRQKVNTYLGKPEQRGRWWEFVRRKLREGRQAYVVTPLVDASEHWEGASAEEVFESLANGELEEFRVDLVHGRMTSAEKEAAMARFRTGQTQVLVATSLVEVGVDVPNATLLTIENAERFGLAQLHQLRGRVARGAHPGFCCLFAGSATPEAETRLAALVDQDDGFRLAELDLELRGPGELLGTRQHGLPAMRIADFVRDTALLEEARRDARAFVESDPRLEKPEHALLRRQVIARYGAVLELGDVG